MPIEQRAYTTLSYLDTVHDFWKERTCKSGDDDDEDISGEKMEFIHNYIISLLQARGYGHADINSILSQMTNGGVTSATSKFEITSVKYFESVFREELYADTKEEITFEEIIEDATKGGPIRARYDASVGVNNVLEIKNSDKGSFGKLTAQQKNIVANFILNYMYPGHTTAVDFTFDGKSGIIGKIFRDIEQTSNLMTPQNVADSAPTSFKSLHGRNKFLFVPENGDVTLNNISSNTFTKDRGYALRFTNRGFSNKNQFGFNLEIRLPNTEVITIPFSEKQSEGPSVNYLIDVLRSPDIRKIQTKKSSTLKVGNYFKRESDRYITSTDGFALDLKRIGDHEQVNVSERAENLYGPIILCTIDHLCSLYARLLKKSCIFHVGENLTLFRFNKIDETDEGLVLRNKFNARRKIETIDKLTILIRTAGELKSQSGHLIDGIERCTFEPKTRNPTLEFVIIGLIKLRLNEMAGRLSELDGEIEAAIPNIMELKTLIDKRRPILDYFLANYDILQKVITEATESKPRAVSIYYSDGILYNITDIIDNLSIDLNPIYDLFSKMNLTLNQSKVLKGLLPGTLGISKNIFDETTGHFITKGKYTLFNFINDSYLKLYENLLLILQINAARSERSKSIDLYSKMTSIGYFDNLYNITEGIEDEPLRTNIRELLNLPRSNYEIVEKILAMGGLFSEKFASSAVFAKIKMPGQRGGTANFLSLSKKMIGGAGDPQQYYDLSDLLRDISGIAAQFIESIISKTTLTHPRDLFRHILTYREPVDDDNNNLKMQAINLNSEILFIWEYRLFLIQNSENDYTYKPNYSEYFISFILSFFSVVSETGEVFSEPGLYFNNITDELNKVRMHKTLINDIAEIYMTLPDNLPAEIMNLFILTLVSNTMDFKYPSFYDTTIVSGRNNFEDDPTWSDIPRYVYSYIKQLSALLYMDPSKPGRRELTKALKALLIRTGGKKIKKTRKHNKKISKDNNKKRNKSNKKANRKTRKKSISRKDIEKQIK